MASRLMMIALALSCSAVAAGAETSFEKGLELKRQEKFAEAAEVFAKIVKKEPKNSDALQQLALLQGWLKRYDASVRTWKSALALSPDNLEFRMGLARVLNWKGALAEAKGEYRRALGINPREFDALMALGDIAMREARPREARKYYELALVVRPDDPSARARLSGARPPAAWRLDAGYLYDGYNRGRVAEHNAYLQLGRSLAELGRGASLWFRGEEQRHFQLTDGTLNFGGALRPVEPFAAELELGVTPDADFRSDWQLFLAATFPWRKAVVPSFDFRHFGYSNGSVDIFMPGLRVQLGPKVAATYKHSIAKNISGKDTQSGQARVDFEWSERYSSYAGYAQGNESLPPLSTAFNEVIFLGAAVRLDERWGVRCDYGYESRPRFFIRHSAGAGLTYRF